MNPELGTRDSTKRRVVLGVCGGIAAYKACDVVRELYHRNCDVRVLMTRAATRFVTPLTFAALSGNPVETDLFREDTAHRIDHIDWGRWAEMMVIAPATMDFIGKVSHGLADDLLTNTVMAFPKNKPLVFAPAMNTRMWEHPVFRDNLSRIQRLNEAGYQVDIVSPASKELACGEEGEGAFPEVSLLVNHLQEVLDRQLPSS